VPKTRTIVTILIFVSICGNANGNTDINNVSQYFGFEEMEIIKLNWDIKSLKIADFNGDGRKDIAVANNRKAKIEILLQKEGFSLAEEDVTVDPEDIDVNRLNPVTRFNRQSVAVSQKIHCMVSGDLNSDGMMDLAFYGDPKGLYVILQKKNDDGKKADVLKWQTRRKIDIDDGLQTSGALVCADLNNDGKNDLALASRDVVYLILQKDDGSLAEAVKYPNTARILGIKASDLNGDSINDLILITDENKKMLNVRFGLKTGQLSAQQAFFIEKPYALKVADVDGANGDEILTVDSRGGRLMCYGYQQESSETAKDWPIAFYPLEKKDGANKRDLVAGDFDGDGKKDIVISDPSAAELILFKQTKKLGLAEPKRFGAFSDITNLSAADIDGDKKAEIAVLSVKEKVIGISEFEDGRLTFPKTVDVNGEPVAMELADIDKDGKIDCVYVSKDVNDIRWLGVIYDLGGVVKAKAKKKQAKEIGEVGNQLKLLKLKSNPDGIAIVDVDQDGLSDVLIFDKYNPPAMLVRQTDKRQFEIVDDPASQASLIKNASLTSIAVANVDSKKGDELLIAQKNFARSMVFESGKTWGVIDQYNAKDTENNISAVAAFELEGPKKHPSILLLDGQKGQLLILKPSGDNTYRFEKQLDVGKWNASGHLKMLFESFDGGKKSNILIFDGDKFALITLPDKKKNISCLENKFIYETKIKDGVYGNLATGDINSDGKNDIVMVEYKNNHIEILTLDNEQKPIPAIRFKLFENKSYRDEKYNKASVEPRELQICDVTGDGKADLVTIIHDRIIIYPQD